jgi:hypothetical protein
VNIGRVWLLYGALKSGLYPKGTGMLHRYYGADLPDGNTEGYCCLGVASDVAHKFGLQINRDSDDYKEIFAGCTEYMPSEVMAWFGFDLPGRDPYLITPRNMRIKASQWNDGGLFDSETEEMVPSTLDDLAEGFRRTYLEPQEGDEDLPWEPFH